MEENFTTKNILISAYGFNETDFKQIADLGISLEKVVRELNFFKNGIDKVDLDRKATIGDGIIKFSDQEMLSLVDLFNSVKECYTIEKFVPASGAASRMFKFLIDFVQEFNLGEETINAYINRNKAVELSVFLVGLEKFPFYKLVSDKVVALYPDYENFSQDEKYFYFIKVMLSDQGFDFANKPKGVLPFHKNKEAIFSPITKHLNEATAYAVSNSFAKMHLTVSEEHLEDFKSIINASNSDVKVDFSFQKNSTNTLAIDLNGNPFRVEDGSLFFRPGGHGALIENLNSLQSDVVFIKNIDNVAYNHFEEIVFYKKALGGLLLKLQKEVFGILNDFEKDVDLNIDQVIHFMKDELNIHLSKDFEKFSKTNQKKEIIQLLNRPIRVCGMVKNEGEPGGGPFWVKGSNGGLSLQIVESSQIDLQNENQIKVFRDSTHFNPVDLVCGLKNFKGEKFDLTDFVDQNTGFIVKKTKNGKDIMAYELPGLWNGAMANWITIFVEVPLVTFNPVKTVNDLLKPAHQHE